jgi:very-short-patch-repair endonuclease
MFKTLSAVRRGRRSEAQPGEERPAPSTLVGRARLMRREPTEAEDKLWQYLRASRLNGWKFRNQHPKPPYIADFVCIQAKLIVEDDGSQHGEAKLYDARRTRRFARDGYRVLRFWNNEVLFSIQAVVDAIRAELTLPLPTAARSPSPQSGEGK